MLSYEKKEGEKILLSIFGFKICVVVFNRIMCCYAETKDLVISRVFSPGDFRLRGWGLQEEWKGISGPEPPCYQRLDAVLSLLIAGNGKRQIRYM